MPSGSTSARFSATGSGDHVITAETGGVTHRHRDGARDARAGIRGPDTGDRARRDGRQRDLDLRSRSRTSSATRSAARQAQLAVAVSGANSVPSAPVDEVGGGVYRARYTPRSLAGPIRSMSGWRASRRRARRSPARSAAGPPDARGHHRARAERRVRRGAGHLRVPGRRAGQSYRSGRGQVAVSIRRGRPARRGLPGRRDLSRTLDAVRDRHLRCRHHARRNAHRRESVPDSDPVLLAVAVTSRGART